MILAALLGAATPLNPKGAPAGVLYQFLIYKAFGWE